MKLHVKCRRSFRSIRNCRISLQFLVWKVLVYRARKIQKFLSQPFHVAENFTGIKGVYVPLKETIRGFKAILDGEMDEYPENAFFNAGTIEDVRKKAEQMEQNA